MEKIVYFQSKGRNLFGIFHPAENMGRKFGVIFINSGMQNRVGPHRIYVKAARRLSQIGFSVLRIDFPGIGESEGEVKETHFDCHDPEDTINAINYFKQEEKIEKIILVGLCAGARNAMKTAAKDTRVDSIVLWSLPIISNTPGILTRKQDVRGLMSRKGAKIHLGSTLKKVFSIRVWNEYLSAGGNLFSVMVKFRTIFWGLVANQNKWMSNRSKGFFEAFESFLSSGRKGLFVYGERDIMIKEEFEEKFKELSNGKRHSCEYYIIPNANHSYTSIESESNVIDKTVGWLAKLYALR